MRTAVSRASRIVVVSPHFDDGVLSLGAAIASWGGAGASVELLTVFGCDPHSAAPTGGWDRRSGFATEGESARARRDEDRRACRALGATPVWLPYGSVDYDRHGEPEDVRRAVAAVVDGADLVFLPGFPLSHPDHRALVEIVAGGVSESGRVALYVEQPYARRGADEPSVADWVTEAVGELSAFAELGAGRRARLAKWRALRHYESQLPLLGMRRRVGETPRSYAFASELVAWSAN